MIAMFRKHVFLSVMLFLCACVIGFFIYLLGHNWIDVSVFEKYKFAVPSRVFDDEGNELARFELARRQPCSYGELPQALIHAFVSAEDHHFFSHPGISLKGIVRSFLINLYNRRIVQGASTITQQLARCMMRSYQRTYLRKIQEILLAFQLERQLSKEQIFEMYVNNIYFGPGIYGVQAACRRFWNKSCTEITVAQAATLAAVAASVNLFSPLHAPAGAVSRRNVILKSMEKLEYITPKEYKEASVEPLNMYSMATLQIRHYLIEWIRAWAEDRWGREALYHNGLSIMTTINGKMQEHAEVTFKKYLPLLRKRMGEALNGGMITLESSSGYIKAMIGGYNFKESQFNRALQARRPMGSSFKPYLYAYALQSGMTPDTVCVDEPLTVTMPNGVTWSPQNWTGDFGGGMTLVRALSLSNNIIAIKLFLTLGAASVSSWIHRFGIDFQNEYPSNALGTCEVSVEQNAAAFNVFANNGVYVKPSLISSVRDKNGHVLFKARQERRRVLDSRLNSQMVNMLSYRMVLAKALHQDMTWFDGESIGKTGATNGASTAWFVGSTPEYTTAIYLGRDDNKTLGKWVFASDTAFPIWLNFYNSIKLTKKHFHLDPSLQEYRMDWISGESRKEGSILDNVVTVLK